MFSEGSFEYQFETLSIKIWMLIWRPRRIVKLCRILTKFPNKMLSVNLSETKGFWKVDLKQPVAVLQSLREIFCNIGEWMG